MKQLSKKDHSKKKGTPEEGHPEGNSWCNCRTRNYRYWLGVKKYGHQEQEEEKDGRRTDNPRDID